MVEKDSLTNENTALASDREKFLKESSTLAATYQALREKYDTLSQESENYKNQVGHLR
jgi:molecular chaperone GrpE (heat shock protein)